MKYVAPSPWAVLIYVAVGAVALPLTYVGVELHDAQRQAKAPPWLTYVGSPWEVKNKPKPGEAVRFDVTRCNSSGRGRSYELSHFLVRVSNRTRIVLPAGLVPILEGCHTDESAANVIPVGTPAGWYYVEGYAEVDNGMRPVTVYWASKPFEVLAP